MPCIAGTGFFAPVTPNSYLVGPRVRVTVGRFTLKSLRDSAFYLTRVTLFPDRAFPGDSDPGFPDPDVL